MKARVLVALVALAALVAGAALLLARGREGAKLARAAQKDPARVATVHVPCVIATPIVKVVRAYRPANPKGEVRTDSDKPLPLLEKVSGSLQGAHLVVTMGDVEMKHLVAAGTVDPAHIVALGRNGYALAVIAPTKAEGITSVADLASPAVKRIAIEDPQLSTLGNRAEASLRTLGLLDKVAPKLVRLDPTVNLLDQLLSGKADAAIVYQDCLFSEGGSPPKTVKIVGALPADSYQPITYEAAPLKQAGRSAEAGDFLRFLTSARGQQALQQAGMLKPAS